MTIEQAITEISAMPNVSGVRIWEAGDKKRLYVNSGLIKTLYFDFTSKKTLMSGFEISGDDAIRLATQVEAICKKIAA